MLIERKDFIRLILYKTGVFDSQREIDANKDHRLVRAANAAADAFFKIADEK